MVPGAGYWLGSEQGKSHKALSTTAHVRLGGMITAGVAPTGRAVFAG